MPTKTLKIILTVGIPASGKSTWAKQVVAEGHGSWVRINKDDIRAMIHADKWSPERERLTEEVRDAILAAALAHGKNVIVDDTNLNKKHIKHIQQLVRTIPGLRNSYTIEFEEKWFDDSLDFTLCMKRNVGRNRTVPPDVMEQMFRSFMRRHIEERM